MFNEKRDRLRGHDSTSNELPIDVERLQFAALATVSPLYRLEIGLHPWVAFIIMPVFALANAGVPLDVSGLTNPVAVAIAVASPPIRATRRRRAVCSSN